MGLFDTIWPKTSYVSMAKVEEEARLKRQTAAPLLAEDNHNNPYETVEQSSQSNRLLKRVFPVDVKVENTEEYEVKLNDNMGNIAARFWTTPSVIKQLNRLSTNHLFVGQVILVPKLNSRKNSKSSIKE